MKRVGPILVVLLVLGSAGCSIRKLAIRSVAGSLASTGDLFASEDDPELVRDAAPFALKAIEAMIGEVPRNEELLLGACQGFTQYAYAFVETDALLVEPEDFEEAERLGARALRLYLRARDYCLRGLEVRHPGITERLQLQPEAAAADLRARQLPLIYWTGAAWGAAIAAGADRPDLLADLPAVSALMQRVLELDEAYGGGAAHEVFISLETLEPGGGSQERAREHFERALELSRGRSAGPYVSLAMNVSVANQDRPEFEMLIEQALAIDPDTYPETRLQNLLIQKRARHYLDHADELILDLEGDEP